MSDLGTDLDASSKRRKIFRYDPRKVVPQMAVPKTAVNNQPIMELGGMEGFYLLGTIFTAF